MTLIQLEFIQGNTKEGFEFTITDKNDSSAINLTGSTVEIFVYHKNSSDVLFSGTCTITDAAGGICEYVPSAGQMDNTGDYTVQLKISFADVTIGRIAAGVINIARKAPTS